MAAHHLSWLPLLTITTLVISSTSIPLEDHDALMLATQEMTKANYFAYVMLINMAPPDPRLHINITFLMPNDMSLASSQIPEGPILPFLLRHSIPSPLLIDQLDRLPSGTVLPSSEPNYMLSLSNKGMEDIYINNVRITSPNLCTSDGTTIRCHGIDGVLLDDEDQRPHPFVPPDCHRNISIPGMRNPPPIGQVPPDPLVPLPPGTLPSGFPGGGHPPPVQNEPPNQTGSSVSSRCVCGRWMICMKFVSVAVVLFVVLMF